MRYDNALGTVNNKSTIVGHEWNFTHVHFLFFNIFNGFIGRFAIVNNQPNFYAQGNCVGNTTQNTFVHIKSGFTKVVAHVFEGRIT